MYAAFLFESDLKDSDVGKQEENALVTTFMIVVYPFKAANRKKKYTTR